MLLPGCWWTKEPPSAGFKDGVVGGWGWIKNQSNKEWVLEAEDSTWNCEPCTPVKHGLGVHSCHCFSFLFLAPFPFVLHVTVPRCLFVAVLVHAFVGTVCSCSSSQPMGQQALYFIPLESGEDKDHRLMSHLNVSLCTGRHCWAFSASQCHTVPAHLALWRCVHNPSPLWAFCRRATHSVSYWCHRSPPCPCSLGKRQCVLPQPVKSPRRTTLVHWRWIQGAAFGGADTAAFFHRGPH